MAGLATHAHDSADLIGAHLTYPGAIRGINLNREFLALLIFSRARTYVAFVLIAAASVQRLVTVPLGSADLQINDRPAATAYQPVGRPVTPATMHGMT